MPSDSPAATASPSAASVTTDAQPKRLLSTMDVMSLIIGIVIGAGIFSSPALIASNAASMQDAFIAWTLGGFIALAGALCYAELTTSHPHAGGDYHFLRLAFGEKIGFLFAWARLTVIPTGSIAVLGYVFGDYATEIYSLGAHSSAFYAVAMIVVMTALNVIGLKSGSRTQNILTALEVGGVLLIIVVGLTMAPSAAPAAAAASTSPQITQWGLILVFVIFTYGGWNEAAYASAEIVNPQRNLPRALFWSLAIITVAYLLVNAAFFKVLGLAGVSGSTAVAADTLRAVMGDRGAQIISLLIAISALTSANATILLGARTTYAFGCDEPMFRYLGKWNARHDVPTRALLTQSAISLALVAFGAFTYSGFKTMVEFTAPVFWLFFVLSGVALFVLRRRWPDHPRPFRVPLYPITPLIFIGSSLYLLYSSVVYTGRGAFVGVAVLIIGGVLLYVRKQHVDRRPVS
ncbi:amino acid permease [Alcaligenaceae bacterium A4P071]|nr:amino acid permease [Alcaligenaceae bacterium B3P038]MDQ2185160.1 amino acid permease [Alcaligenaceae bacterium A4P071]